MTDKRVIIISKDNDKPGAMRIADIDELRNEKADNGNYHIRIGSSVFKTPARRLSGLACEGRFDDQGTKIIGLVLYNVSDDDAKAICNLLKPAIAREQK